MMRRFIITLAAGAGITAALVSASAQEAKEIPAWIAQQPEVMREYYLEIEARRGKEHTPEDRRQFLEKWSDYFSGVRERDPSELNRRFARDELIGISNSRERYDIAYELLDEKLQEETTESNRASALSQMGLAGVDQYIATGAPVWRDRALACFQRALAITDQRVAAGDSLATGYKFWLIAQLAQVYLQFRDPANSGRYYEEAAAMLAGASSDDLAQWRAKGVLAPAHEREPLLESALAAYSEAGNESKVQGLLNTLAAFPDRRKPMAAYWAHLLRPDRDTYLAAVDRWVREHPAEADVAILTNTLAQYAQNRGDLALAAEYYRMTAVATNCATENCRAAVESAGRNLDTVIHMLPAGSPARTP